MSTVDPQKLFDELIEKGARGAYEQNRRNLSGLNLPEWKELSESVSETWRGLSRAFAAAIGLAPGTWVAPLESNLDMQAAGRYFIKNSDARSRWDQAAEIWNAMRDTALEEAEKKP